MTTNQTIDGVPRELTPEMLNELTNGDASKRAVMKLRWASMLALLDAPAEPFILDGWSIDHSAGRPILMHNNCSVIEAEQAYGLLALIQAAAQAQGEHIAEQPQGDTVPVSARWSDWSMVTLEVDGRHRTYVEFGAAQSQGEPVACAHDWLDDGEYAIACTKCGAQENHDPCWRDMATAPTDGTMVRLLVEFEEHSTEDSDQAPTIGANNFDNDGEDVWRFAGWCWSHDHFTEGKGTPVGWLPMLPDPTCTPASTS